MRYVFEIKLDLEKYIWKNIYNKYMKKNNICIKFMVQIRVIKNRNNELEYYKKNWRKLWMIKLYIKELYKI